MFSMGNRGDPPATAKTSQPSYAELVARACWMVQRVMADPDQTTYRGAANVPLVDLCLDLRATFISTDVGRAVFRPSPNGPQVVDPVERFRRMLDAAHRARAEDVNRVQAAAAQDVAELQAEIARLKTQLAARPADGTAYVVSDGPKMLRETLAFAQTRVLRTYSLGMDERISHMNRLQRLIDECDRHRPIGPDGKHGDRHTATCGCDNGSEEQG